MVKLMTLSSTTGAYKLAAMKRDSTIKSTGGSGSSSAANSPRSDSATVWKKPEDPGNNFVIPQNGSSSPLNSNLNLAPQSSLRLSQQRDQQQQLRQRPEESVLASTNQSSRNVIEASPTVHDASSSVSSQPNLVTNTHQPQFQSQTTLDIHTETSSAQQYPEDKDMNNMSEEELMKLGIHLTHRLSAAEISQRDFNWDEDDEADEYWTQKLKGLVPEKPHIASEREPSQEQPKAAPWASAPKENHAVPISEQIKELSEIKQRRINQQYNYRPAPHYNYYLRDNRPEMGHRPADFDGPGGPSGPGLSHHTRHRSWDRYEPDLRYRYQDHENRYRAGNPPPRPELYNAQKGHFEAPHLASDRNISRPGKEMDSQRDERSISPRYSIKRRDSIVSDQLSSHGSNKTPSIEGDALPQSHHSSRMSSSSSTDQVHNQTPIKSISEEQKEIMRQAREKARKRKEEELQREKERNEASKRRAEEFTKQMEEKHKTEHEQHSSNQKFNSSTRRQDDSRRHIPTASTVGSKEQPLSPKRNYRSHSNVSIDEQTIKAVNSIIGDYPDDIPENNVSIDEGDVKNVTSSQSEIGMRHPQHSHSKDSNRVGELWGRESTSSNNSKIWNTSSTRKEGGGVWSENRMSGIKHEPRPDPTTASSLFGEGAFSDRQRSRRGSNSRHQVRSLPSPTLHRDRAHIWSSSTQNSSSNNVESNSESWRNGRSVSTTSINKSSCSSPSSSSSPSSQLLGQESPNGRSHSKFFPTAHTDYDQKHALHSKVGWSGAHSDGPDDIEGASSDLPRPRVVLPPSSGRLDGRDRFSAPNSSTATTGYKQPSINSIEALQSTIVKKLGSAYSSTSSGSSVPVLFLPVPKSPIVSNMPVEENWRYQKLIEQPKKRGHAFDDLNTLLGLKTQSDIVDGESFLGQQQQQQPGSFKIIVKLGDYTKAEIQETNDLLLRKVRVPGNEFSNSAYFQDSWGYVHRREFENPDTLASYTTIHLPGSSRMTVHKGMVTSRPFGKALRADAGRTNISSTSKSIQSDNWRSPGTIRFTSIKTENGSHGIRRD